MSSYFKIIVLLVFMLACKSDTDDVMDMTDNTDTDTTMVVIDTTDMVVDTTDMVVDTTDMPVDSSVVSTPKINGFSFVSPRDSFPEHMLEPMVTKGKGNWMAISPFAGAQMGNPAVNFDFGSQWWGERPEGVKTLVDYANNYGMKVMIKPQVWMWDGWVGGFDLETEEDWQKWESDYEKYIMVFAEIAANKNVELFCIGTEYKIAAVKREAFFRELINKVRNVYSGKLTYAANWDNYHNIRFWDELDYIGVDSYFNLVEQKTPNIEDMKDAWQSWVDQIKMVQTDYNKQILFTEYGYMSSDFTAWKNWENEGNLNNLDLNMQGQVNAFEAFFQTFWTKDWVAGGFIWKWFHDYENRGGTNHKEYSPQRKPAENMIGEWYSK